MPQITPYLAIEPTAFNKVELRITDAYGHCNGRIELCPDECRALSDQLQILIPIDVEAVDLPVEPVGEVFDWGALTKAQIFTKVLEDYGVELDANDTKARLVAGAQEAEATFKLA